jgi:hypothetical protein
VLLIPLRIKAVGFFEPSGRTCPTTPRNNPGDLLPQQSCDGNINQSFVSLRILVYLFLIVYLPYLLCFVET